MISGDAIPAYNVPSGILFDMHREAAGNSPYAKTPPCLKGADCGQRHGGARRP
jgi:acyl CoA:acetate/3-ketoacid CoA transferase